MVDIHAHIIPGVDDGAEIIEDSIAMLQKSAASGVDTIVATPHLIPGSYMVSSEGRDEILAQLRKKVSELDIPIEVLPGRECYLTPEIFEFEKNLHKLTINDAGRYVIVELPFHETPDYVYQMIFDFQIKGIIPIIAHAERYHDVIYDPTFVRRFIEKDCLIHVNVGSILGKYGSDIKATSHFLLRYQMAHIIASDMHTPHSTPLGDGARALSKIVSVEESQNLLNRRPRAVVESKTLMIPEPLEYRPKRNFWNLWGLLKSSEK
jgi:protein-tyrosine phosphatase